MKKSSFERTFDNFYLYMISDAEFLMKIESAKRVVSSNFEKRSVFSAYVFSICATWEIIIEELLIDCLNKDTSRYKEFTGFRIRKNISRDECKAILLGIGYVDFKSIDNLKKVAKNILVPKFNPIKEIPTSNGRKIDEFFTIRNYLAHYSYTAKRALEKVYTNRYSLKTFRDPGDFLLAVDRRHKLPRMAVYIDNFLATADIMAKYLGIPIEIL